MCASTHHHDFHRLSFTWHSAECSFPPLLFTGDREGKQYRRLHSLLHPRYVLFSKTAPDSNEARSACCSGDRRNGMVHNAMQPIGRYRSFLLRKFDNWTKDVSLLLYTFTLLHLVHFYSLLTRNEILQLWSVVYFSWFYCCQRDSPLLCPTRWNRLLNFIISFISLTAFLTEQHFRIFLEWWNGPLRTEQSMNTHSPAAVNGGMQLMKGERRKGDQFKTLS